MSTWEAAGLLTANSKTAWSVAATFLPSDVLTRGMVNTTVWSCGGSSVGAVTRQIESRAVELGRARRLGKAARPSREAAQRSFLLTAMTEAAAAEGFEACRVEDVLERSGLSRSSFYLHFKDKTECFMAAFEVAVDGLLTAAREAVESASEPESRLEAGLDADLGRLSAQPEMGQLALVEIHTAGAKGGSASRRLQAVRGFARRGKVPAPCATRDGTGDGGTSSRHSDHGAVDEDRRRALREPPQIDPRACRGTNSRRFFPNSREGTEDKREQRGQNDNADFAL